MSDRNLPGLSKLLWTTAATISLMAAIVPIAQAQIADQTVSEAVEDAFFTRDRRFYANQRFPRSITWYLGPFVENEMASDGRRLNRVYREAMTQQTQSDATVRTPDLPNPFPYSLMTAPIYQAEAVPPRPSIQHNFFPASDGVSNDGFSSDGFSNNGFAPPRMSAPSHSLGPVRGLW